MNLNFDVPSTLLFGANRIQEVGGILEGIASNKTMIVCDKAMIELGFVKKVTDVLDASRITYAIFDEVMPNPTDDMIHSGADYSKSMDVDSIIALGGGSVMDSAKAINILLTNEGHISDFEGVNKVVNPTHPLILIPTTSGTASEVTSVSVVTDSKRHKKMVIAGQHVGGNIALCDPELTLKLPASITAATGMDALTHAIEAYISKWASPVTDPLALDSIRHIVANLETAVHESTLESRNKMMMGSVLAGMAFNSALLGLVHSLAHPLSAHYDVAHGVANAIFLPYIVEYNLEACKNKITPLASAMGIDVTGQSSELLSKKIVEKLNQLSDSVQIPTLKSLNIPESDFRMLAEEALVEMSTMTNPKDTNIEDLVGLLNAAYIR